MLSLNSQQVHGSSQMYHQWTTINGQSAIWHFPYAYETEKGFDITDWFPRELQFFCLICVEKEFKVGGSCQIKSYSVQMLVVQDLKTWSYKTSHRAYCQWRVQDDLLLALFLLFFLLAFGIFSLVTYLVFV